MTSKPPNNQVNKKLMTKNYEVSAKSQVFPT